MCARQLDRVIGDRKLAAQLSRRASQVAAQRNDRAKILERQLEIYRCVLDESGSQPREGIELQ
jgi:hypothetical protein